MILNINTCFNQKIIFMNSIGIFLQRLVKNNILKCNLFYKFVKPQTYKKKLPEMIAFSVV